MNFVFGGIVALAAVYATISLVYVKEYVEWGTKSMVRATMLIFGSPAIGYTLVIPLFG